MHQWQDTTPGEMRHLCGLIMYMGLVHMPSLDCYWRTSKLYSNDIASKTMTRNRFQMLLTNWHFANSEDANGDRAHKVSPLLQLLVTKFGEKKTPGEDIVIDETMIPLGVCSSDNICLVKHIGTE